MRADSWLMERLLFSLCSKRSDGPRRDRASERGATLTEYALLAALVVVVGIGAITALEGESGSFLTETGSDIGTPREFAADIDPDLPEAPDWLAPPPPPVVDHPEGAVLMSGAMSTVADPNCYLVDTPGTVGSTVSRQPCAGNLIEGIGAVPEVAFQFTDIANDGLCLTVDTVDPTRIVMNDCDGSARQHFTWIDGGGGSRIFTSVATGECLNGDVLLAMLPCDGSDLQKILLS